MLPVIAYVRVATKQRAAASDNLSGQKTRLSAYAKQRGLRDVRWFKDDSSASGGEEDSEYPEFGAACDLALRKGWPILVVDLGRMPAGEKGRFIAAGGKIYDLSGFGADEAEMTRRVKSAKKNGDDRSTATLNGLEKARAAGSKFGTPAPGNGAAASVISRGKETDIRRRELETLRDEAAKDGVTSAKDFAEWLNRRGHLTARGRRWTDSSVRARLAPRRATGGAGPIPTGSGSGNSGETVVNLTADQIMEVRELLSALENQDLRSIIVELVTHPMPRQLRDRLVTEAQLLQEKREARRREELENMASNPE